MIKTLILIAFCLTIFVLTTDAQENPLSQETKKSASPVAKKTNSRPVVASKTAASGPFEKADVKTMAAQCVALDTEAGVIELEMFPESAPETVRNFLNLAAIKAFDTTVFNRVVPGFIVQGGDLATREKLTPELDKRLRRTIIDEPNAIKHERGIISMARASEPNSATTNFFILVGTASHLDGTFAAFGRVTKGMETVDAINKMPVENEKPTKPVRLKRATVASCSIQTKP